MTVRNLPAAALILALSATRMHAAPAPSAPIVYVAQTSASDIEIFRGLDSRVPAAFITRGVQTPLALAVDRAGTLYVGNNNNTISAYAAGTATPAATYTQGISFPAYLAIGPDGSLFVSNGGTHTVEQFPPGSLTASRTITFSTNQQGIALDRRGNLYVVTGMNDIFRFAPGATQGTSLGFALQNGPKQLGFDRDGNVLVIELFDSLVVLARDPPHAQLASYGFPTQAPDSFALTADGRSLMTTDASVSRVVRIIYPQDNFANVIDGVADANAIAVAPPFSGP